MKARGIAVAAAAALTACTPTLPFTTATPPLILAPASRAGVADGRGRFREIFCAVQAERGDPADGSCANWLHRLDGESPATGHPVELGRSRLKLRIRIVPGIFGKCAEDLATPFADAIGQLGDLGYEVAAFSVDGRSSSKHNAGEVRDQIVAMDLRSDEQLVLIGHSKGMSDILELIGGDRTVVPGGSAIVSLTGVVAGTPIADMGENAHRLVAGRSLLGCPPGDQGGIASLTRRERLAYLAEHPLPRDLHYFSLPTYTHRANISRMLKITHSALARIDGRNDGNVIFHDSVLPGSTVLAYLNADHWAVAMPFEKSDDIRAKLIATRNHYPRPVLLEAIARTIEEHYLSPARQPGAP